MLLNTDNISVPEPGCKVCAKSLPFNFTFAFQPIVNFGEKNIFAYEALVRGSDGQGAQWVLNQVTEENRYRFDQECRIRSIRLANQLGIKTKLSINFMPNAVYNPELCIRTTLATANDLGFDIHQIIFEVLEDQQIKSPEKLNEVFSFYKKTGFLTAIDDFGSGYAGLKLLSDLLPNIIKIDMYLIRDIDKIKAKQAIVKGIITTSDELGILLIAEGIESEEEALWFDAHGVKLMQGYYFSKPVFEGLVSAEAIFSDQISITQK